ncbi:GGDEF domain-containing protein [Clostridium mediterraneense]|uniref:GGDEF domain-containing protein n=1 Tax=Clostridium mediterraneense TaxID=1805472 RepID=UPI000830E274|nr:GGDEF domain-containing protein [Clostridium mediterraneense]
MNLNIENIAFLIVSSLIIIIMLLSMILIKLKVELQKGRKKEMELTKLIDYDYLTKVYSKKYIYEKLKYLKYSKKKFYVIMFDLDNFKFINDTYGHNFGDEVLIKVSSAINEIIKEIGIIGRFGGEEFLVIIDKTNYDIDTVILKIKDSVKDLELSKDINITLSGGAKICYNEDITEILLKVDELLYKVKRNGKDNILIDN